MLYDLLCLFHQVSDEVQHIKDVLTELDQLKEELFPLARRATMLYALLRSLPAINRSATSFMKILEVVNFDKVFIIHS